jgi:lipopolysaccharide/colanic/teichoic acid biosynthesis glycosyltransferase
MLVGTDVRVTSDVAIMKKVLDLSVSSVLLVVFAPVMAVIGAAIITRLGRPIFFRQLRPGLHARPFTLLKFRTMRDVVSTDGAPLPDAERLTPLGLFLRSMSLDELPQLWNVLRGDMSLVGPRPLLMDYLSFYTAEQMRRFEVCPGITGWAQVNGRNAVSWQQRLALDVWYVDNRSLTLDIKILWLTLIRVIRHMDINAGSHETMPRFDEEVRRTRGIRS